MIVWTLLGVFTIVLSNQFNYGIKTKIDNIRLAVLKLYLAKPM